MFPTIANLSIRSSLNGSIYPLTTSICEIRETQRVRKGVGELDGYPLIIQSSCRDFCCRSCPKHKRKGESGRLQRGEMAYYYSTNNSDNSMLYVILMVLLENGNYPQCR